MALSGTHPLYGGPSYNYSYPQELDPTELQYFQEQELQDPQQQQQAGSYLGQSNYQASQSYTQSFWNRYNKRGGFSAPGFGVIPEGKEVVASEQAQFLDTTGYLHRRAEAAVQSWKVGNSLMESQIGSLALSSNASSTNLKEFLSKRSEKKIKGLHKLASQGDRTGIMSYLKQNGPNAPLDELDGNGCTALMYAAIADSPLALEMLLNFSARREQTDSEGRTAVHYASFFGKHRALKFLVSTAANWTPFDSFGRTPLHWSCASKSTQCMTVLLKHSQVVMGNINPQDREGMTPLHCAAHFCRPRHIALLHEAQCDFTIVDCEEKTALHWTATNPNSSCIQILVELYPSLLNKQDASGSSILHYAAQTGAVHLVATLLEIDGIDVDVKDCYERTALHWACAGNNSEIVRLLLIHHALDSCIDSAGLTALHYCIQSKSVSSVDTFVSLREMTHLPNNEGRTPLMEAAATGFPEGVLLLLKNKAVVKKINHRDPQGMSSLHLAAEYGLNSNVSALLSKGADPDLQDVTKKTPIFLATQNGNGDCIQSLISKGCEVDLFDVEGQTPLHKTVMYNQLESLQVLAMNGVDLNSKDPSGNTALHMAAYGGYNTLLAVLLSQSANPNLQDENGVSPVHLAAMEGHAECITTLIEHKAYVNFLDFSEERRTPVDYARQCNHTKCVEILIEAGGVGTEDIRGMAALTIQTAYRGYRARQLCAELAKKSRAVTCLSRYIRGFLQRQRFAEMKRRLAAAIKIQAYYRGYLERVRFQIRLFRFREQEQHWKLIENFSKLVQRGHQTGELRTFDASQDLSPEIKDDTEADDVVTKERKQRLETSMKMRAIYQEKQRRWQEFREAERQRRINKASKQEMNHLNTIIAESKARREYTNSKFHSTLAVRSYHQAALVIQRAYRRMRLSNAVKSKLSRQQNDLRRRARERAARIIQRTWRDYRQNKLYKALHFMSIMTGPVIAVGRRTESPPPAGIQKGISITGSPKRKMHRTLPSGFQVFRPLTRDLLHISSLSQDPVGDPFSRPDSQSVFSGRSLRTRPHPSPLKGARNINRGKKQDGITGGGKHVTLPALFTKPMTKTESSPAQDSINLPVITPPSNGLTP